MIIVDTALAKRAAAGNPIKVAMSTPATWRAASRHSGFWRAMDAFKDKIAARWAAAGAFRTAEASVRGSEGDDRAGYHLHASRSGSSPGPLPCESGHMADLSQPHEIWKYEIPKFDGDLSTPNMYVPLPAAVANRKVDMIMGAFGSQRNKPWFKADNLLATMRLRGIESRATDGFAEAFHCRKLMYGAAAGDPATPKLRTRERRGTP